MTAFNIEETRVIGLLLADGTEIWPPDTFHGRPIDTPEDRQIVADALAASSGNLGIPVDRLLDHFRWIVRVDKIYTTSVAGEADAWPIKTPALLASPQVVDAEIVDEESSGESLPWVGVGPDPRGV